MIVKDFGAGSGSICEAEVLAAQAAWGEGIVAISASHRAGGDYVTRAKKHIETLYAFDLGAVLFKPTLASQDQFRLTYDSALSYFVGRDGTEDTGFAIRGWTDVRWENCGITLLDDVAIAMGNYFFSEADGTVTKVEYTFAYIKDPAGHLKITLHHSSVPFVPEPFAPE